MVEFDIKINKKQHLAYIPQELARLLGTNIKASANCIAVLMYPENAGTKDVLRSLEIIKLDLEHKIELSKREALSA